MVEACHQAKSLYHESTIESADSIESHPFIAGLFALGTYQVDQKEEGVGGEQSEKEAVIENEREDPPSSSTSPEYSRKGTLRLKKVERGNRDDGVAAVLSCQTVCEIPTAAILDMKWLPFQHSSLSSSSSLLSVATADSRVSLYSLQDDLTMQLSQSIQVNKTSSLCLSLDWARSQQSVSSLQGIVSQSDGTLASISNVLSSDKQSPVIDTWQAHDYEAWTTAFDCHSQGNNIAWSGGDDLSLKGWDLRSENYEGQRSPIFTHKKSFEGGVTSMQSHPLRQHLWAIGSYDGGLRLFDARHTVRPLSTTHVEGGIWRIKWHPTKPHRLLVGCMHNGFKVMHIDSIRHGSTASCGHDTAAFSSVDDVQVVTRFDEHASLAYGCDWDRGESTSSSSSSHPTDYVYSCSFYDAMWHAWQA